LKAPHAPAALNETVVGQNEQITGRGHRNSTLVKVLRICACAISSGFAVAKEIYRSWTSACLPASPDSGPTANGHK